MDRRAEVIHVLDIALLPEFQGRGVGTVLLQALFAEAETHDRRVSLYVEKFNPARTWYQRLGFREVSDTESISANSS